MKKILDASDGLHSGKAAASHNEGKERFTVVDRAIGICLLQVGDKPIPKVDRVVERFHRYGALLQARDLIEIRHRTEREDQMIEFQHVIVAIKAVENSYRPVWQIDTLHFAVDEINLPQDFADGIDDVREVQIARGDFVQHRCEQEKILFADHGDFKIRITALFEFQGGIDTAKSSTDYQSTRLFHVLSNTTSRSHNP